jgi:hypothetical protein
MSAEDAYYKVKVTRHEDSLVVYLLHDWVGPGDAGYEWGWAHNWGGEHFDTLREATAKMRTNVVRELRAMNYADGSPVWKVQVVRITDDGAGRPGEQVVWPKEDVCVLNRMAAI